MVRLQKWFTPSRSVERAKKDRVAKLAREVIAARLIGVEHYLQQLSGRDLSQVEGVHQLRVWCRRSEAAIKLFRTLLVKSKSKQLLTSLKLLRRAAGPLRDRDVLLAQLTAHDSGATAEGVANFIRQERAGYATPLRKLRKQWIDQGKIAREQKRVKSLVKQSRHQDALMPFFQSQLAPLAEAFFEQSRAKPRAVSALHELRIAGKRLRYAMEIAASSFDESFRDVLYQRLSLVQDRLGAICDHATQSQHLADLLKAKKWSAAERKWISIRAAREKKLASEKIAKFRAWWSDARQASLRKLWSKIVEKA